MSQSCERKRARQRPRRKFPAPIARNTAGFEARTSCTATACAGSRATQFQHVAQRDHQPRAEPMGHLARGLQSDSHRRRLRVVGIVDDDDAADFRYREPARHRLGFLRAPVPSRATADVVSGVGDAAAIAASAAVQFIAPERPISAISVRNDAARRQPRPWSIEANRNRDASVAQSPCDPASAPSNCPRCRKSPRADWRALRRASLCIVEGNHRGTFRTLKIAASSSAISSMVPRPSVCSRSTLRTIATSGFDDRGEPAEFRRAGWCRIR